MKLARAAVWAIAGTLPRVARERYREEWFADLDGAREVDLSPATIVAGALTTAITIDRMDATVTGMPLPALARHRGRWAAALLSAATVLLGGLYLSGMYAFSASDGLIGAEILTVVGSALQALAVVLLLAGGVAMIGALTAAADAHGPGRVALAFLDILGIALIFGVLSLFSFLLAVLLIPAGLAVAFTGPPGSPPVPRRRRMLVALPFTLGTLVIVVLGALHLTVWNPLARAPGRSLEEIYAEMVSAGQLVPSQASAFVIVWAAFWSSAAIALLLACGLPRRSAALTRRRIVVLGLLLIALTVVFKWAAGFAIGMALADTFMTSGADAAPTGPALNIVGQFALAAALLIGLAPGAPTRASSDAPAEAAG